MTIETLAQLIAARVRFASMPPLGGCWEPVRSVTSELSSVGPGDVYFAPRAPEDLMAAYEAYARGAVGVVTNDHRLGPWPGTCVLEIEDWAGAVARFEEWQRAYPEGDEAWGTVNWSCDAAAGARRSSPEFAN